MRGLEAVKYAVEDAGVGIITYVPGYPITELAARLGAEISVNEKVALEIALGASATGCRSMAVVKQVGMNLLADPLAVSSYHSVGSGLVVMAGDDLGPRGSQVEMDSRLYGLVAEIPVLDPRDPATLYASTKEAFEASDRLRVPVIVRVTWRLLSADAPDIRRSPASGAFGFNHRRLDSRRLDSHRLEGRSFEWTTWDLTARGRQKKHRREVLAQAAGISEATPLNKVQYCSEVGIVASGYPAFLAAGLGASLLAVGYAHPLPWKLVRKFIAAHQKIIVAEEPMPLIESWLQMSPKVRGRLTGDLPFGPLELSDLERALERIDRELLERKEADQELTGSPGVVCEPEDFISTDAEPSEGAYSYELAAERGYLQVCQGCPFAELFTVLGRLEVPVAGDAGCVIRAARPPYQSVDVVYGLGSSVGVASGFGKKGIAVIGDFALAHSGLQGLINAMWRKRDLVVILLKNDIAAATGGQEAPDLTGLLESLLPLRRLKLPAAEEEIKMLLGEELARPGTSAIVAYGRCAEQSMSSTKGRGP